jgi:hypothetical protein
MNARDKKKKIPEYSPRQKAIYRSVVTALKALNAFKASPNTRDSVRKWILDHAGYDPAVPRDLEDLKDRDMRRALSTGRKHGEWPCVLSRSGGPKRSGGYYLAANADEVRAAAEHVKTYLIDESWNLAGLRQSEAHARGTPLFPAYEGES